MARVYVINEASLDSCDPSDWTLCFQWCRYLYDDGTIEHGYRFIWRRPKSDGGSLQAARGQARIPSIAILERLVERAKKEGWGDHDASRETTKVREAAKRLRKQGMIVDLELGFVGWPNQAAAMKGALTPEILADAKLIEEYIGAERGGDELPIAGSITT